MPLIRNGQYYGVLGLGVNPNETALASAALTREVTVAVFISIWVLVIFAVFNALTITRPVKELLRVSAPLHPAISRPASRYQSVESWVNCSPDSMPWPPSWRPTTKPTSRS